MTHQLITRWAPCPRPHLWVWHATHNGARIGARAWPGGIVAHVTAHPRAAVWFLTRDGQPITDWHVALDEWRAMTAAEHAAEEEVRDAR